MDSTFVYFLDLYLCLYILKFMKINVYMLYMLILWITIINKTKIVLKII